MHIILYQYVYWNVHIPLYLSMAVVQFQATVATDKTIAVPHSQVSLAQNILYYT